MISPDHVVFKFIAHRCRSSLSSGDVIFVSIERGLNNAVGAFSINEHPSLTNKEGGS